MPDRTPRPPPSLSLRRLQVAWGACSVGHWALFVTLSVHAYAAGGAAAVGAAALARMLPAAAAAPFCGLLADRRSRRDVLVGLAIARAVVLVACAACAATGAPLAAVLALAAVFTGLSTGHKPAQAGLIPALAETPSQLAGANATWSAVDNVGFLAGSVLGGVMVAATSTAAGFGASAAAFAVAVPLLLAIPRDPVPAHRAAPVEGASGAREAVEGFVAVSHDRNLRLLVGLLSVSTLVEGAVDVLVVVVALELLDLGAAGVGWLNAAWGFGGLLGGAAALALIRRGRLAAGLGVAGLLVGAPLALLAAIPHVASAAGALVTLGVGYALLESTGLTLLQRLASDHLLARAVAVVESAYQLTTGIGAMVAPLLVVALGVRGALLAVAAVLPLAVAARWTALDRLERIRPVPEEGFVLLRASGLFAPLPLAAVEALARELVPVRAAAGEPLVRAGEVGDRLYLVAEGQLSEPEALVNPGDHVGAIALLLDAPHPVTVTARADTLLLALDREVFLAAVTGHPQAAREAARLVAAAAPGQTARAAACSTTTRAKAPKRRLARSA